MSIVNLFARKASRMSDATLLEECIIHLKAINHKYYDKEFIARMTIILEEANTRPAMIEYKQDFDIALKVLKFIGS